jgi:hypothetical protein
MQITGSFVNGSKNTIPYRFAAVATAWIVLGSSGDNVCAQNNINHNRMIIPVLQSGVVPFSPSISEFETSSTLTNPPASFIEQIIKNIGSRGNASVRRIIYEPAIAQIDPALIHSDRIASYMAQDEGALEKVTVTDGWTPVLAPTPTSVTLWDELAPPVPVRIPADAALQSTPSDVADTEARTTQ